MEPPTGGAGMKPIEFKEQNCVFAKNQPPYLPLPAHRGPAPEGVITSCWRMSPAERVRVLFMGIIYVREMTYLNPPQPIKLTLNPEWEVPGD